MRIVGWAHLLEQVDGFVSDGGRHTIAYANANVLNAAHDDEALRAFLNEADVCYCDGNGVRFAARVHGDVPQERRTGADWIRDFATHAEGAGGSSGSEASRASPTKPRGDCARIIRGSRSRPSTGSTTTTSSPR